MKKQIKYICLCFLAIGLFSCDKDEGDLDPVSGVPAASAVLIDNSISALDQNAELTIKLFSSGTEFQTVEIEGPEGSIIGSATVADSTATFNSSIFGDLTAGETININIVSTLSNGEMISQPATIGVGSAITLEDTPATVMFMDTTTTEITYSTGAVFANIDQVSVFRKTSGDAEYTDTEIDLPGDEGALNLGAIDYEELNVGVGDTIFYKFVAESGSLSRAAETQVIITTQDFGAATGFTLSTDAAMNGYVLSTAGYATDSIPAEIMFMEPAGFSTADGIEFVEASIPEGMTAAAYVAGLDLFEAEMAFEAGSSMSSVSEVQAGDVYIYKAMRDGVVYYGTITIGDVTNTTVNGEETTSFDLNFAEGTIIRG